MFDKLIGDRHVAEGLTPESFRALVIMVLEEGHTDRLAQFDAAMVRFRDNMMAIEQAHAQDAVTAEMVEGSLELLAQTKIAEAACVHSVGQAVFAVAHFAQA